MIVSLFAATANGNFYLNPYFIGSTGNDSSSGSDCTQFLKTHIYLSFFYKSNVIFISCRLATLQQVSVNLLLQKMNYVNLRIWL